MGCCCGGVEGCCNRVLPKRLFLTVVDAAHGPCEKTFAIDWDGAGPGPPLQWQALAVTVGTCVYDFYLKCTGTVTSSFSLTIKDHATGVTVDVITTFTITPAPTCDPLFLPFTNTSVPGDFAGCGCVNVISRLDVNE